MSPVWGQHRWGHAKWGAEGLSAPLTLERKVLSANHPWFRALGLYNAWREAEFQLWTVDPDTLTDETQLPHIAGGLRESSWEDEARQHESLSFQVLDPTEYRTGGAYAALAQAGVLLRLYWQVRSIYGEITLGTGLYRVTRGPDAGDDTEGTKEMTVEAEGWLERPLRDLTLSGNNPLGDAVTVRDNMLPLGLPIVWGVDTYATLVAALVFAAAGHRLRVPEPWRTLNWWGTSNPVPTEPPEPAPVPGDVPPNVFLNVTPTSATDGASTVFTISWNSTNLDPTGGDAIFWFQGNLSTAAASAAAAGEPSDSIYLLPTLGQPSGEMVATLAPNFGAPGVRFWYWHRVAGVIEDFSALVALT